MILAVILLSGLWSGAMVPSGGASQQSPSAPAASSSSANIGSAQSASQQNSTSSTPSSPSAAKPAPIRSATAHPRKKKVTAVGCDANSSASGAAPKDASMNSGSPDRPGPTAQAAATNCPPKKKIVPLGGSSEPSIQLEGGALGEQASHEKDSTNQMLSTTEQNLKKLEGRQLTSDQQNMVSQARQFMAQAKDAMNSGDYDRARTLAQKAELLSEDLIKPENQ